MGIGIAPVSILSSYLHTEFPKDYLRDLGPVLKKGTYVPSPDIRMGSLDRVPFYVGLSRLDSLHESYGVDQDNPKG